MLTFILLVVLAGGVGLIAVSAAEHDDPARKLRRSRREGTSWYERISAFSEEPAKEPTPRAALPTEPGPEPATTDLRTSTAEMAPPTPRRATRGNVPERFTAVEGAFEQVAYPSRGRRVFSTIQIVLLVAVLAVAIAGATGAAVAVIARALDSAIG